LLQLSSLRAKTGTSQSRTRSSKRSLAGRRKEAIKRYAHMRPENYADFVDIAFRTDAGITLPV